MERATSNPPTVVTLEEAAEILRVHRATIFRLLAKGDLPSFRVGRSRRIRVADLEAWMDRAVSAEARQPHSAA